MCLPLNYPNEREARTYMRQRTYTRLLERWMAGRNDPQNQILTPYSDTPLELS